MTYRVTGPFYLVVCSYFSPNPFMCPLCSSYRDSLGKFLDGLACQVTTTLIEESSNVI